MDDCALNINQTMICIRRVSTLECGCLISTFMIVLVTLLHLAGEREPDLQTIRPHKEGQTPSQLTGSLMVLLKFGRRKMLEDSN